jgi:hypothetical protein
MNISAAVQRIAKRCLNPKGLKRISEGNASVGVKTQECVQGCEKHSLEFDGNDESELCLCEKSNGGDEVQIEGSGLVPFLHEGLGKRPVYYPLTKVTYLLTGSKCGT